MKETVVMVESNRYYKRTQVSIPITYVLDDFPVVATPTQALPMTPLGFIQRTMRGAFMKNSSLDGFCFYTDKKLEAGTRLDVKMVNFIPMNLGDLELERCRAKVIWCRKNRMASRHDCYEVGVQKIRADKLPLINFKSPHFGEMKCV